MAHFGGNEQVIIPRNFKLLIEYDAAIGKEGKSLILPPHEGFIQYGADDNDLELKKWQGVIIGPQGRHTGEFMYQFSVFASPNYPLQPPTFRFLRPKINMPCVTDQGHVDLNKIQPPFRWNQFCNIADMLMAIRVNVCNEQVSRNSVSLANTSYV